MSDYTYDIVHHRSDYPTQAFWNAVLFGLTDKSLHNSPVRMVESVMQQWRARVLVLRDHEFPRMQGVNFQYARNCPPVGVVTATASKPCGHRKLCPFCWGRHVVYKTWDRFLGVGFEDKQAQMTLPGNDVIETHYGRTFDTLEGAMTASKTERSREVRSIEGKLVGAVVVTTFLPKAKGKVTLRRNMLAIAEQGAKMPDLDHVKSAVRGRIKKQAVMKSVGFATRFPMEVFKCKDVPRVVDFMGKLGRIKLCCFFEKMHSPSKK